MQHLTYKQLLDATRRRELSVDDVGRELIKNNWSEFVGGETLYNDREMRAIMAALTRDDRDAVLGWFAVVNDAIRVLLETELHLTIALVEIRGIALEVLTDDQIATSAPTLRALLERADVAAGHLVKYAGALPVLQDLAKATRLPITDELARMRETTGAAFWAELDRVNAVSQQVLGDDVIAELRNPPAKAVKQRELEVDALFAESLVDGWRKLARERTATS